MIYIEKQMERCFRDGMRATTDTFPCAIWYACHLRAQEGADGEDHRFRLRVNFPSAAPGFPAVARHPQPRTDRETVVGRPAMNVGHRGRIAGLRRGCAQAELDIFRKSYFRSRYAPPRDFAHYAHDSDKKKFPIIAYHADCDFRLLDAGALDVEVETSLVSGGFTHAFWRASVAGGNTLRILKETRSDLGFKL